MNNSDTMNAIETTAATGRVDRATFGADRPGCGADPVVTTRAARR